MNRTCKKCSLSKLLIEFRKAKGCDHGVCHVCKDCHNLRSRKRPKSILQVERKLETNWDCYLRTKYGITDLDYKKLFETQKGMCPVCNKSIQPRHKSTHLDHDHENGKIRGLLHNTCNFALGLIKENFDTALGLAKYIQEHKDII